MDPDSRNFLCPLLAILEVLLALLLIPSALAQSPAKRKASRSYLPIASFYEVPNPLPPGNPGDLIRSQPFSNYDLPPGVSATRILYHSRSANGEDVAVSGVVLSPATGKAPTGGWPMIAWAHGFSGVARRCAPSLARNLGHGPFLSMYVKLGYAVVATDYAGFGATTGSARLDINSKAADVLYSVAAARSALPQLSTKWIALGEADGALTVAALAELQGGTHDPNYLGGIAVSGIADLKDIYERAATRSPDKVALLAAEIRALYPQFRPDSILSDAGLALYHQLESTCSLSATPTLTTSNVLKPAWNNDVHVKQFFDRNTLGQKLGYGPLLVIQGEADTRVLPSMTAQAVARMCKQGERIEFDKYPNLDGGQVLGESIRDQIAWIQARFAGIKAPANCP